MWRCRCCCRSHVSIVWHTLTNTRHVDFTCINMRTVGAPRAVCITLCDYVDSIKSDAIDDDRHTITIIRRAVKAIQFNGSGGVDRTRPPSPPSRPNHDHDSREGALDKNGYIATLKCTHTPDPTRCRFSLGGRTRTSLCAHLLLDA